MRAADFLTLGSKVATFMKENCGLFFAKSGEVDRTACLEDAKSPCGAAAGSWSAIILYMLITNGPETVTA